MERIEEIRARSALFSKGHRAKIVVSPYGQTESVRGIDDAYHQAPADLEFLLAEVDRLKADATTATFTNFHHYGGGAFSTDKMVVTGPGNLNFLARALDFAKMATVKDGVVEIRIDNASALLLGERHQNERMTAQLARIKAALMAAGCSDFSEGVAEMAEEFLAQPEEG